VLSSFSLILTGECNYRCRYCYQVKDHLVLDGSTARRAIEFFLPRFDHDSSIHFYGGEPLLAWDTIRDVVRAVTAEGRRQARGVGFSVSTNGSLLDDRAIEFFARNRFTVLLSFDGLAQDEGRREGSSAIVSGALARLLERPEIEVLTNSVFTPETVGELSASIEAIAVRGVRDVQISFATGLPWRKNALDELGRQLGDLRRFLLAFNKKTGEVPVANFAAPAGPGLFECQAGRSRMALSPDGRLWGCHLFYDFHKTMKGPGSARFCLGTLDSFIADPRRAFARASARYSGLRMDLFHTPRRFCGLCRDLASCAICPVDAAFSSRMIGRISPADCRIRSIVRRENRLLWKAIEADGGARSRVPAGASPRRANA